jgi:hypothetical protein
LPSCCPARWRCAGDRRRRRAGPSPHPLIRGRALGRGPAGRQQQCRHRTSLRPGASAWRGPHVLPPSVADLAVRSSPGAGPVTEYDLEHASRCTWFISRTFAATRRHRRLDPDGTWRGRLTRPGSYRQVARLLRRRRAPQPGGGPRCTSRAAGSRPRTACELRRVTTCGWSLSATATTFVHRLPLQRAGRAGSYLGARAHRVRLPRRRPRVPRHVHPSARTSPPLPYPAPPRAARPGTSPLFLELNVAARAACRPHRGGL